MIAWLQNWSVFLCAQKDLNVKLFNIIRGVTGMSYAVLFEKHLMSIYMRLDKIEKSLPDLSDDVKKQAKDLKKTSDEIGKKFDEKASELNQQITEID